MYLIMILRHFTLISLILYGLIFLSGAAQALDIKKIRFGEHPDKLRTVIELDRPTDFKAFVLPPDESGSYRIVVDLPAFTWSAGNVKTPRGNSVSAVHTGDLDNGFMRVVLNMAAPPRLKTAFILPAAGNTPTRLVIDSENITKAAFDAGTKKIFGTLAIQTGDLNTIIAKQDNIQPPQQKEEDLDILAMFKPSKTIIPQRKPEGTIAPSSPTSPLRKPIIVIDAGHGGADPGAIGANKTREKDITLSAAHLLKKELESTGRYRVYLTRSDDRYLKLHQRRNIARDKEADLFISLHADSINKSNVRGASIYTLSDTASDAQTAKLAARENQADLIAGVDLSHEDKEVANILIDLAMRDTMNQSKFFANTVVDKLKTTDVRILERPHRYAGFAVLKSPDVPSVLFEMGFMSNNSESRLLASPEYQKKIIVSLRKSIDAYFEKVRKNAL